MTALSRFDFIIDIPRDTQRQIEIALQMYERIGGTVGSVHAVGLAPQWARKLQVMVGLLRTEHEAVHFPPEITQVMQKKHEELRDTMDSLIARHPWLSDFQTRLANSVYKFAAAYARMNHRPSPLPEDIEHTFRLIRRKFDFLSTLAQLLQVPTTSEVPEGIALNDWLQSRFAGREVKTKEILGAYQQDFNIPPERRTIERHLSLVAQHVKKGIWAFPASQNDVR